MGKKVKKPINKGVAKVPVIMQMEALECGAASLAMIMAYFGRWVSLEQARIDCGVSRDGSNAKNILLAARSYGFKANGYRFEPEELRSDGTFPCIIHWNFDHFVVCNGFRGDKVYLNDPARGSVTVSTEEFDNAFTGISIIIEPGENFEPGGERKSVMEFAVKRLKGAGSAIAFATVTAVTAYLFGLITPVMSQVFLDRILTKQNPSWVMPFFVLMILFAAAQIVSEWINALYSLKISGKLSVVGNSSFMWKVLGMPMEFFSQRMSGDILQRQAMNAEVAETLVDTVAPLVLNTVMMFFYLFVMIRRSLILTFVGIAAMILNLIVSRIISEKRMNIMRVQMRDSGKLSTATIMGIDMAETIKAGGAENGFFEKWAGYQASVNAGEVRFHHINATLGLIPEFLSGLANYVVLFIGVWYAMKGEFTVGMIISFQGFLSSFMGPATTLIGTGQTIMEMRTQMERIDDVMEYPSDEYVEGPEDDENTDYGKLRGEICINDITFGYSRLAEPLIRNFSLNIKPGSKIALVGMSGSGKSTLSKLLSGLYRPWSGTITYDGRTLSEIDRSVFTGSLAVVDQDIILFEDTISANIKMWDNSIEDFEMIMAARDAQIHEDIMEREGGYGYRLAEGGKDLSGGQRQRLEIARVLAQDPSVIILDEATSALDAQTEYEVVKAIGDRGITCIVIAHRLSTIRDCDEIIVLDHGVAVERGTHEELVSKGGYYTELVTNE
ncbi:MAG: NHLP family bacteriocin export ABC transporter peptidase/permease/ATPase subunit [Lachnospiraceae bacterium]|nr:NHLP family bacteriocin export ABC transporter peptidase/permease/ATPase subunit [Lachnospiraceae bacterium]